MKCLLVIALLLAGCAAGDGAIPITHNGRMVRVQTDTGRVYECVSVSTSIVGNTGTNVSTLTFGQLIDCEMYVALDEKK